MSGLVEDRILGMKLVGSVGAHASAPRTNTSCMIAVWEAGALTPRGLIEANILNDYRTAAGIAAATKVLSRPDSRTHVLFGAGKLSYPSVLYVSHVRPIERLIIISRTRDRIEALAARIRATPELAGLDLEIEMAADDAVADADVITTVTRATTPLFDGARVKPGAHINLGGGMRRQDREVDDALARRAIFFLDEDESCRLRAGDIALAIDGGALEESRIRGEIGAVLAGRLEGRLGEDEITVFKSLGIATQDLCLAAALLDKAAAEDAGTDFDPITGVVSG